MSLNKEILLWIGWSSYAQIPNWKSPAKIPLWFNSHQQDKALQLL